jgi:hypothetical protein
MALKKDKAKVLDEVWTEDRIRSFLDVQPAAGVDADFHTLQKAYQQMRADDFKLFIGFFIADQRNIDAADKDGQTLVEIIANHRNSQAFVDILQASRTS